MLPTKAFIDTLLELLIICNPHLPNELSHPYQLDESIFHLSGVFGVLFLFLSYFFFYRNSCEQTVNTLTRCRVLRRLIWVYTVCLCPKNGTPGLYWLTICMSWGTAKPSKLHLCENTYQLAYLDSRIIVFAVSCVGRH